METWTFEPPTEHYDEHVAKTDEEICRLLKYRKDISHDHPGFPKNEYIKEWSEKYAFRENFLNDIFSTFLTEDMHKPVVEPENFLKNIPVLKSYETDGVFYSVPLIRQFENASVVHLNIVRDITGDINEWNHLEHDYFKLSIDAPDHHYECREDEGGGIMSSETYTFVVSPALPEEKADYDFVFSAHKSIFSKESLFEFRL